MNRALKQNMGKYNTTDETTNEIMNQITHVKLSDKMNIAQHDI